MKPALVRTIALLAAATLLSPLALSSAQRVMLAHDTRLKVIFPHEKHNQRCVDCHHANPGLNNTIPCVTCHRSSQIALKLSVEPRFHAFCRDCHADQSRAGLAHGPIRDCAGCHGASVILSDRSAVDPLGRLHQVAQQMIESPLVLSRQPGDQIGFDPFRQRYDLAIDQNPLIAEK